MKTTNILKRLFKKFFIFFGIIITFLAVLGLITYKPLPDNKQTPTYAYMPNIETLVKEPLLTQLKEQQNKSGVYPLANGRDAFLARLALIENAKHSLDLQYYIWHDDISGRLLAQRILASANRGIKVRMLLDDHTMSGMDGIIATLNQHQNIEVRLFNPYMQRSFRPLGYLSDFFSFKSPYAQ